MQCSTVYFWEELSETNEKTEKQLFSDHVFFFQFCAHMQLHDLSDMCPHRIIGT